MNIQTVMSQASEKIGGEVQVDGLMRKVARLKQNAEVAEDVLGFDYVVHRENSCYEYYVANPPLVGFTQPVPVECPVGVEVVSDVKVDYKAAIKVFHGGNWGSKFVSLSLVKPLVHPQVSEPYWYFKSSIGTTVVIGADSGDVVSTSS